MSDATGPAPVSATSLRGQVCLVTGATGGMGQVIVTDLARRGATVVLVARTASRGEAVRSEITAATGNPAAEVVVADLSDQAAVRGLAEQVTQRHDRLHLLVNNAGAHFPQRRLSVDGLEMHLAVDHLAGFLLTRLLADALVAGAPSRVVDVVSEAMADTRRVKVVGPPRPAHLDLRDLNSEQNFNPMRAYAQAKLANLMCGYALARRLADTGVTVNAVHPGLVSTGIVDAVAPPAVRPFLGVVRRFLLTPEEGAQGALRLATDPALATVSGAYFNRQTRTHSPPVSYDTDLQEQVWTASSSLVGLPA